MLELFEFNFFQNALIASLLISIACAIVGSLVMINRLFSMVGGITHGAFGGIGFAFYFSLPILASTLGFTLFLALIIAFLAKKYPHRSDNFIAVIWAFGMAFGLVLIDLSSGYKGDLMAYLFGMILAISKQDLYLMAGVDLVFVLLIICFYRQFIAISFDSEFAKVKGVASTAFYYLLILMIAFCIVICIRVVGLILVIALLSIPCFIAENFTKKLGSMMFCSFILSVIFCILGLFISYVFNLSSGASIIMIACIGFVLALVFKHARKAFRA